MARESKTGNAGTLREAGSVVETPLPQILHDSYALRATGLLHLERGGVKKVVYLREGYPIFVRSNLLRECLGQMLTRQGNISAEQCQESARRAKESGRLQGTVLVEMGLLTPTTLREALRSQVTEKLLEIFGWPEGTYRFIPACDFKKGITAIDLSPATLILQGIRRYYPPHRTAQLLLSHRSRYLVPAENPLYRFQEMELSRADVAILADCRGSMTLQELLDRNPLTRTETEQLLAALLLAGILESRKEPSPQPKGEWRRGTEGAGRVPLRETFLADYARMMGEDYFTLLGISPSAEAPALRKGYFALVKTYHPDRFHSADLSPELEQKVKELFQRINEAHETLADPLRRKEYQARLAGEGAGGKVPDIADVLQAETAFQRGTVFLRNKQYQQALDAFQLSVRLSPEEPEYLTCFAWALHKADPADPRRRQQARDTLERALHLNPRLSPAHLYLGLVLKAEGREKEAEKSFERAIQINPRCTEALRELRLFNMRRGKGKGLIDRVFRK